MKTINLFCLPFAGGNAYSYRKYMEKMPPFIKMTTLEYPGRGRRSHEPILSDMQDVIEDLYRQMKDKVLFGSYAIYGHSMGGLAAYSLSRKLIGNGYPQPVHLFITGANSPSAPSRMERKTHLLEKKEFFEEIKSMHDSPDEILQNEELMEYFEPILRNDFKAVETFGYQKNAPLNIPVTVIRGSEDDMTQHEVDLWQLETTCPIDFRVMEGNHFFIYEHCMPIVDIITEKLSIAI